MIVTNREAYWFLRKHAFLQALVEEAGREIRKRVSEEDAWILCEMYRDPESDEELLFLLVHTNLPPDEEAELERSLYAEWWLDAMPRARGKMVISVE